MIVHSASQFGDAPAIRFKQDGEWHDVSYSQLADTVQEIGLGLIDIGIEAGERICILANTRPDWTYADMAASSPAPSSCPSTRRTRRRSASG